MYLLTYLFVRKDLIRWPWLSWNLLWRPCCPWTWRHPPASALLVLGLTACTNTSGWISRGFEADSYIISCGYRNDMSSSLSFSVTNYKKQHPINVFHDYFHPYWFHFNPREEGYCIKMQKPGGTGAFPSLSLSEMEKLFLESCGRLPRGVILW